MCEGFLRTRREPLGESELCCRPINPVPEDLFLERRSIGEFVGSSPREEVAAGANCIDQDRRGRVRCSGQDG